MERTKAGLNFGKDLRNNLFGFADRNCSGGQPTSCRTMFHCRIDIWFVLSLRSITMNIGHINQYAKTLCRTGGHQTATPIKVHSGQFVH